MYPLLFLLYIDDISNLFNQFSFFLFGDGTKHSHFSAASGPKMFKKLLSKRLFEVRRNVYKSRQRSLLQSATESYFKLGQLLYYKVR